MTKTEFTETELRAIASEIGKMQQELKAAGVQYPRENAARLVARRNGYDYRLMGAALGRLGPAIKRRKTIAKAAPAPQQMKLEEASIDLRICLALEKIANALTNGKGA